MTNKQRLLHGVILAAITGAFIIAIPSGHDAELSDAAKQKLAPIITWALCLGYAVTLAAYFLYLRKRYYGQSVWGVMGWLYASVRNIGRK